MSHYAPAIPAARVEPMTVIVPLKDVFSDAGKHPAGEPWEVTERHAAAMVEQGLAKLWTAPPPAKPEPVKEVIVEKPSKGKE